MDHTIGGWRKGIIESVKLKESFSSSRGGVIHGVGISMHDGFYVTYWSQNITAVNLFEKDSVIWFKYETVEKQNRQGEDYTAHKLLKWLPELPIMLQKRVHVVDFKQKAILASAKMASEVVVPILEGSVKNDLDYMSKVGGMLKGMMNETYNHMMHMYNRNDEGGLAEMDLELFDKESYDFIQSEYEKREDK